MPKASVEVKSRREGEQIIAGLADPSMRALVEVTGALSQLNLEGRKFVLKIVNERLAIEESGQ